MKIIIDGVEEAEEQKIEDLKNYLRRHDWSFEVKEERFVRMY